MAFRLALAFGCSVRELLVRVDSRELAEWQAFERVHGPIDGSWNAQLMVEMLYQLQLANAYFIQANSKDADDIAPDRFPLPWEFQERVQEGLRMQNQNQEG